METPSADISFRHFTQTRSSLRIVMKFKVLFSILCCAILGAVGASAQTAITAEADTTALGDAPVSIVINLQQPGSPIIIDAPAELLRRAAPLEIADTETVTPDGEEASDTETDSATKPKTGKMVGYRVQVYADNNVRAAKAEARLRERAIGSAFPSYGTYVSYASPYWRLRVGDFRSQYEAEKAAAEIRSRFPRYAKEVRVIRDRVNIK